jgi:hypothetical protein
MILAILGCILAFPVAVCIMVALPSALRWLIAILFLITMFPVGVGVCIAALLAENMTK